MAEIAKQRGSEAYRRGDFEQAAESFSLAARIDPTEPIYTSNLSAVLYEQGQYVKCCETIIVSWRTLRSKHDTDGTPSTPPPTDTLAPKLAARYAKAKLNAVLSGQLSLHEKKAKKKAKTSESNFGIEQDVETFVDKLVQDGKGEELKAPWIEWRGLKQRCRLHEPEACQKAFAEAQRRLRDIPIFRHALEPTVEYYKFGNDPLRSLLNPVNKTKELPIDLRALRREKFEKLAFLFGGSGDARHAFGTIFHFNNLCSSLDRNEKVPALHLTLVDLHPAALARVLLVLTLMRKVLQKPRSDDRRLEFETTIFYLYTTILMPDYCHQIVIDTAKELIIELSQGGRPIVTKSLHIGLRSLSRILPVLEYWANPLPKTTKRFLEVNPTASMGFGRRANSLTHDPMYLKVIERVLEDRGLKRIDNEIPGYDDPDAEYMIFEKLKILLPPREYLHRHPNIERYIKKQGGTEDSRHRAAQGEIEETWKPNPTMFDNSAVEHPRWAFGGYPSIPSNPFDVLRFYLDAAIFLSATSKNLSLDTTAFAIVVQFFRLAMEGMEELDDDLTVEFVAEEVNAGVAKLVAGDLGPRPANFPKKYLRMWLSNVPDYTGGVLGSVIYIIPYLEPSKYSMVLSNCLLNCSSFPNLNELCFNYTYCHSTALKKIFGILLRDEQGTTFDEISLSVAPPSKVSFPNTISKRELHTYLSLIFLRTLCTAHAAQLPFRIDEPNTLIAFFHLLLYLAHHTSCPPHWLGDLLQSIVNDQFVTDVIPYTGVLPITPPAKEARTPAPRRVNLKPWRAELDVILTDIKWILPFALTLPEEMEGMSSAEDVGTYTAHVVSTVEHRLEISPFVKSAGIVFYSPRMTQSVVAGVISRVADLLDVAGGEKEVQLFSCQESVDTRKGVVSWRMTKTWFEKMVKEDWKMMLYLANQGLTVTKPVDAKMWFEFSASRDESQSLVERKRT